MATTNITQLRRVVFREWTGSAWNTFTLNEDDLGQDTIASFNIAPRKAERATQKGTSSKPIPGTFDNFTATINFLASDWKTIGRAIRNFTAANYTGAAANAGQMTDANSSLCSGDNYLSVVLQGICDDGSTADVEFTRCIPSLDSDVEIGTSSDVEVELALNPQIYNPTIHSNDGYSAYSYRFGDQDTTKKMRLDATTGAYVEVEES